MRLGGPVFGKPTEPGAWLTELKRFGYSAAYCPGNLAPGDPAVRAYADAANAANVVIAEVGAWSNPLSPHDETRNAALDKCRTALALADEIGARCCVNIAGSRGQKWDGPHRDDLTEPTFDAIVEMVRSIIDAVKPARSSYALETMPWMYPDSADSYVRLIRAIDRKHFAVHLDPVNLICSPQRYFNNAAILRECFAKLGPHIRSCHAKDILLGEKLTVHLDEVRAGMGALDYPVFLEELNKLDPDTPLMIEHLPTPLEYVLAATHIRSVARKTGIRLR